MRAKKKTKLNAYMPPCFLGFVARNGRNAPTLNFSKNAKNFVRDSKGNNRANPAPHKAEIQIRLYEIGCFEMLSAK